MVEGPLNFQKEGDVEVNPISWVRQVASSIRS